MQRRKKKLRRLAQRASPQLTECYLFDSFWRNWRMGYRPISILKMAYWARTVSATRSAQALA